MVDLFLLNFLNNECECRFIVGMERHSYPELGFSLRHGNFVNGSWSLLTYLVASWHGIPSCRCYPFSKYTCNISLTFLLQHFQGFLILSIFVSSFYIHYTIYLIGILCSNWFSLYYEQALLSAIVKRVKGFIKLRMALGTLHAALPDATSEELQAYDDECAICRVSLDLPPLFFFFFFLRITPDQSTCNETAKMTGTNG